MKKVIGIIVVLLIAFGAVACAPAQEPAAEPGYEVVVFNDPVLEEKVREAMNKPDGDITVAEAEAVKELRLDTEWQSPKETQIKDITALKYFVNLERLELSFHAITDISPLSGLVQLRGLSLGGNPISDITPLGGLQELGFLTLFNCQANDYSVLKNMNLHGLHIDWSTFNDLNVLSEMKDLQILTFSNSQVSDISPIANLTNLKTLKLENCPITDLSPLQAIYPNLEEKDFELN